MLNNLGDMEICRDCDKQEMKPPQKAKESALTEKSETRISRQRRQDLKLVLRGRRRTLNLPLPIFLGNV